MILSKFEVEFYVKEDGKCPFMEFYYSMNKKLRAKTLRGIQLLENNGSELREPYSKMLDDGIFELRTKQGSDISRVLYFFIVGHKIILTNGYIKKTQKTDKRQIDLAKRYREDYIKRKVKNNE